MVDTHELQGTHGLLAHSLLFTAGTGQAEGLLKGSGLKVDVGADQHVVQQGQFLDDLHVLEGSDQTQLDDVVDVAANQVDHFTLRLLFGALLGAEQNLTAIGAVELGDTVECSGLTGAVGADQAENLIFVYMERQGLHGLQAAELDGQVGDLQCLFLFHGTDNRFDLSHSQRPPSSFFPRLSARFWALF